MDTLSGFFAIDLKPTSSKDPFALRRSAIGLIRLIVENKLEIKLKDIINYSFLLFSEQEVNFDIKLARQNLYSFISDRLKWTLELGIGQANLSYYNFKTTSFGSGIHFHF